MFTSNINWILSYVFFVKLCSCWLQQNVSQPLMRIFLHNRMLLMM